MLKQLIFFIYFTVFSYGFSDPTEYPTSEFFESNNIHVSLKDLFARPADYNQKGICITGVLLPLPGVTEGAKWPAIYPLGKKAETVTPADPSIFIDHVHWRYVINKNLFGKAVVICGFYVVPVDDLNVPGFYEIARVDSIRESKDTTNHKPSDLKRK